MEFLLNGIMFLFIYWFITLVIILLTDENETVVAFCACGIFLLISWGVSYLYDKIRRYFRSKRYKAVLLDEDGQICYCNSSNEPEYLKMIGYDWYFDLKNQFEISDGWNKDDCLFNTINIRYTPMKVVKKIQAYEVPKSEIERGKEEWNKDEIFEG